MTVVVARLKSRLEQEMIDYWIQCVRLGAKSQNGDRAVSDTWLEFVVMEEQV